MPPHFYDKLPPSWFTPPGILKASDSALAAARTFLEEARTREPPEDWVVSFDWADDSRARVKGTNEWRHSGAGLHVWVYERPKLPDGFIAVRDGLEYLVKIPAKVWEPSAKRLIDTAANDPGTLLVR